MIQAVSVNAVVSLDGAGKITHFNPAAERTFGHPASELLGQSFLRLLPERFHTPYRLQIDWLMSSEQGENAGRTMELQGLRRDGREFPLELCLVTWRITPESLYTVIVRDVTARKVVETDRETLLSRVEAMARTDELTGLPNRRGWDEELRRELARAGRRNYSVGLALIDIDRFKDFNDSQGHQAGDALLREAATAWRLLLRVTDFIARYGGDEFLLLLPDCPPRQAKVVVERLRAATPSGATCSVGMAFWDGHMTAEELVARADEALYCAKRGGRDRSVAAG